MIQLWERQYNWVIFNDQPLNSCIKKWFICDYQHHRISSHTGLFIILMACINLLNYKICAKICLHIVSYDQFTPPLQIILCWMLSRQGIALVIASSVLNKHWQSVRLRLMCSDSIASMLHSLMFVIFLLI